MDNRDKGVHDGAAAHQPSKAELEVDMPIDATPDTLVRTATHGSAERLHGSLSKDASLNSKDRALIR